MAGFEDGSPGLEAATLPTVPQFSFENIFTQFQFWLFLTKDLLALAHSTNFWTFTKCSGISLRAATHIELSNGPALPPRSSGKIFGSIC